MFLRSTRALVARTRTAPLVSPRQALPFFSLQQQQQRTFSLSPRHHEQQPPPPSATEASPPPKKTPIGRIDRRLQITFTCTATIPPPEVAEGESAPSTTAEPTPCHHRSTHEFSRRSYEKGIVLIECPGCKNRHLIADNLQWFSSTPSPAHPQGLPIGSPASKAPRTVEQLVKEKGEEVQWLDGGVQGGTWTVEG